MDGELDAGGSRDRGREGKEGFRLGRKAKREREMDEGNKVRQKGKATGTCPL